VQALVPEEGQWFWLVLDPTPAFEEARAESFSLFTLLSQGLRDGRYLWYNFILEYNNEMQRNSALSLRSEAWRGLRWLGRYSLWATPPLLLFWLLWFARGVWPGPRKSGAAAPARTAQQAPAFYEQYLRLVRQHCGLTPQPGQTPLEFSRQAAAALRRDPRTTAWDLLPARLADAVYRLCYGGEGLDTVEQNAIASQLSGLAKAIATPA
jgi:hypothetical protein